MKSAPAVPYHLRPNKYVERRLFVELLEQYSRIHPLDRCVYMSMGGRHLEDHRLVHRKLGTQRLLSFDIDQDEVARQEFNKPYPYIRCENMSSGALINDLDYWRAELAGGQTDVPMVIWIDFTSPSKLYQQLDEVRQLTSKMLPWDIAKVTLNASLKSLTDGHHGTAQEKSNHATKLLRERLNDFYVGSGLDPNSVQILKEDVIAQQIAMAVGEAAKDGASSRHPLVPKAISAFRYKDGYHQMVTVTWTLMRISHWVRTVRPHLRDKWGKEFVSRDWDDVRLINVPDLSVREQLRVSSLIGEKKSKTLIKELGFPLDRDSLETLDQLEQFERHYRRYPTFVPISF